MMARVRSPFRSVLAPLSFTTLLILTGASLAAATVINVPGEESTIQAGLDAAVAGDTVLVACGTYYEHDIEMKSDVCLLSETGEADCATIDAQFVGRLISCAGTAPGTKIRGFSLIQGSSGEGGAGIWCMGSDLELENTRIHDCTGTFTGYGSGIYVDSSNLRITDSELVGNRVDYGSGPGEIYGGGIYSTFSDLTFLRVLIEDNGVTGGWEVSSGGGGVYCLGGSATFTEVQFINCHALGDPLMGLNPGGGMYASGCVIDFSNVNFIGNEAMNGGGLAVFGGTGASLDSCQFSMNHCTASDGKGGGAFCSGIPVSFTDCRFTDNNTDNSSDSRGGGLFLGASPVADLTRCLFEGNYTGGHGAAIRCWGGTSPLIISCTFSDNQAGRNGGALAAQGDCDIIVDNSIFWGDLSGQDGDEIYLDAAEDEIYFNCSDVDASGVEGVSVQYGPQCIDLDPIFCDAGADDYTLEADSPCLPENNDCGELMGVFGQGCSTTQVIHVPGDEPDIASGLAAANPGDTVIVACGTYFEHDLELDSGITLMSETGEPECVVIDAQGLGRVLICQGDSSTLVQGLTLTHGYVWAAGMDNQIGGAGILSSGSARFRDLFITDSNIDSYEGWFGRGGGVHCSEGSPVFENVVFSGNNGRSEGGGLFAQDCSVTLHGCNFLNNRSWGWGHGRGGGLCSDGSEITITNGTFDGNNTYGQAGAGGAIFCTGGAMHLSEVLIQNGHVTGWNGSLGAGMGCWSVSEIVLDNVRFIGNQARESDGGGLVAGGGLYMNGGNVAMNGGAFFDNRVFDGGSGGAFYFEGQTGQMSQITFAMNGALEPLGRRSITGGHIMSVSTGLELDRCIVAFAVTGDGINATSGNAPSLSCCDVYGNPNGNYGGGMEDPTGTDGNVSEDPLFCDLSVGDLTLAAGSPCLYSSECGLIGHYGHGCFGPSPFVSFILDIPNDQGRQVRIGWERSENDAPGGDPVISSYSIWRRVDLISRESGNVEDDETGRFGFPPGDWDYIATVPARGEDDYHSVVPTVCDSTDAGICWSVFFVSAETVDPLVFFDSLPDSGYSADNLAPNVPEGICVVYKGAGNTVSWEANAEDDLRHYLIYRNGELAHTTQETDWTDPETAGWETHLYLVSARDAAGNESDLGEPDPECVTDAPAALPTRVTLLANMPNPFNPITKIRFGLPSDMELSLRVYGLSGRRIRSLVSRQYFRAGWHELSWNGRDDRGEIQGSGVYFYRLQADSQTLTRKMTLLK